MTMLKYKQAFDRILTVSEPIYAIGEKKSEKNSGSQQALTCFDSFILPTLKDVAVF